MARRRLTARKLARIEGMNRFIRGANQILCVALAVSFGVMIASTALPQKKMLEELQGKLRTTEVREEQALARKEHKEIQLRALREDPAYLELQARDRLNYHRAGERVLRFNTDR